MQLVEQHFIRKHDPRYTVIDEAAFKSKNLYHLLRSSTPTLLLGACDAT